MKGTRSSGCGQSLQSLPKELRRCWLLLLWTCVKCLDVTGGNTDHRESAQLRALSGKASVWSWQNHTQKASLCQKEKVNLLVPGSASHQQPASRSCGQPRAGAEGREGRGEGRDFPRAGRHQVPVPSLAWDHLWGDLWVTQGMQGKRGEYRWWQCVNNRLHPSVSSLSCPPSTASTLRDTSRSSYWTWIFNFPRAL